MTNTTQIVNRHIARTLTELEDAGCPIVFVDAVKRYLRWLRDDLQAMEGGDRGDERNERNGHGNG